MGRKISNILKGEIVSSIFYIALGLCLILIPDQTVNIICKVIFGLIMIAAGVYHIGIYVAEKEKATILDLFTGVITTVLGVFLFFTPQIVIKILPYLLGAFVLVDSFWKLKGTHRLRKAELGLWKIFLAGSLIFILLGIAVMFYPFISVNKMILFCGCILTADGVADLVFLIMLKFGLRKVEKNRRQEDEKEQSGFVNQDSEKTDKEIITAEKSAKENTSGEKPRKKEKKKFRKEREKELVNNIVDTENTENINNTNNTGNAAPIGNNDYIADTAGTEDTGNIKNTEEISTVDTESEAAWTYNTQTEKKDIDLETEKTAEAADADTILQSREKEISDADDMESPRKEIREMLNNHEEPLEEWKD